MDECTILPFSEGYTEFLEKKLYGLSDLAASEELGVLKLRRQPYLNLTGRGVIFGGGRIIGKPRLFYAMAQKQPRHFTENQHKTGAAEGKR